MSTVSVVGFSIQNFEELHAAPVYFYAILGVLVVCFLIFMYFKTWFFARRRILSQIITALYEAPLELNPAEISYLFRRQLDVRDFAGLLAHMAQRGVIHFRKHNGVKIVLPGPKYDGKLTSYEKLILDTVEDNKHVTSKELVDNYQTIFHGDSEKNTFTQHVRHELIKKGHVRKKPIARRSLVLVRSIAFLLFCTVWVPLFILWARKAFVVGNGELSALVDVIRNSLVVSLYLVVPALAVVVFIKFLQARSTGRRWIFEHRLLDFWPQIVGFRQFVYLSENDKLRYDSKELQRNSSIRMLPYAIALGFVSNWRKIVT